MAQYIFTEGDIDSPLAYSYTPSLFNLPQHLRLQSEKGWRSFYILEEKTNSIAGAVHFFVNEHVATTPLKAPFGGIEYAESVPDETVFDFIQFAQEKLSGSGIHKIIIKCPPEIYSPALNTTNVFLVNSGFAVSGADLSSVIHVNAPALKDQLHRSESKRFNKAINAGLTFKQLPISQLENVYEFIHTCRTQKQFALSMSLEQLAKTVSKFSDRFVLFGVFEGSTFAAASIAIRVTENVLYEFYHDHHEDYDHLSPVVMLVSGIYDYCMNNGIGLFDLGTSSVDNQPNFSLLRFKSLLGAKASSKFTFEKSLS